VAADAAAADRDRDESSTTLISETQAQSVWRRAAELQAYTSSAPVAPLPAPAVRPPRMLSESSAYQLTDVKASAVDAGIPESLVQRALQEHGLIPGTRDVPVARNASALPHTLVKDGPKQSVNPFLGTATRIVIEATIDGELPQRDYDLVLDIIRREIGEVGQIGSVGQAFSWSVSNQQRKLQISVMPRGGKTTVRVDEQLTSVAVGVFGPMMAGGGVGLGTVAMALIAGKAHQPLLGLATWLAIIGTAYGTARYTLRRVATSRREKLHEVANQLANQIAESVAAAEPADPRKRLGRDS
jgi:hypothetical protein